jgi:predicted Zn-dependent protease
MNRKRGIVTITRFLLLLFIVGPLVVCGQQSKTTPAKRPLDTKENPLLIGKRDINKHQWNFYSIEREIALGRQLAAEIDQQMRILDDPIISEYVNRVGQNIVLHSDAKVPFTIKVIVSDEVNAFALPGGFFYVNTGLLAATDNESELAGVMAHEIAHVAARHALENFTKGQLLQFLQIPLLIFTGGGYYGLGQLIMMGADLGIMSAFFKFSRNAEKEADILGAQYAWASGYDPNGLITFFEKITALHKRRPSGISKLFMTHPATPDRIEVVKDLISRFPDREEYIVSTSDFAKAKDRLVRLQGLSRRLDQLGQAPGEQRRPTLKRRPEGQDQTTTDTSTGKEQGTEQSEQQKEKPTLKRRNP